MGAVAISRNALFTKVRRLLIILYFVLRLVLIREMVWCSVGGPVLVDLQLVPAFAHTNLSSIFCSGFAYYVGNKWSCRVEWRQQITKTADFCKIAWGNDFSHNNYQ